MRSFFVNRLARIWPVHLVTAAIAIWLFHSSMVQSLDWYPYILTNLFMLQAWVPSSGYVFSLNGVTWSISAEMAFYAAFPMVLVARRPVVLFSVILAGTLAAVCLPDFGPNLGRQDIWAFSPQSFMQQNPAIRFVEFVAGVLAGRCWLAGYRLRLSVPSMTMLETGAVALVLAFALTAMPTRGALGFNGQQFGLWYSQSGGLLWFSLLIFVFAHEGGLVSRALRNPLLVRLGEVSFSLYMVHLLVIMWASREGWKASMGAPLAILAVGVSSLFCAFVLWHLIEVPARRLIQVRPKPHTVPAVAGAMSP